MPVSTKFVLIVVVTGIPTVWRVLVEVNGIVHVVGVSVESDPAGAVVTVGVFEKSIRLISP